MAGTSSPKLGCLRWTLFAVVIVVSSFVRVDAIFGYYDNYRLENSSEVARGKWEEMGTKWRTVVGGMVDEIWPLVNSTDEFANLSPGCQKSLRILADDLRDLKLWAVKMIDATPFWAGGRVFGKWSAYGGYEQCLDISRTPSYKSNDQSVPIDGQYCVVDFRPPLPPHDEGYVKPESIPGFEHFQSSLQFIEELKQHGWEFYLRGFRYGVCVPSTCNQTEVEELANSVAQKVNFNAIVPRCMKKEPKSFKLHLVICLSVLAAFVFVITGCSFADFLLLQGANKYCAPEERKGLLVDLIRAFSISRNFERAVASAPNNPVTSHIHGLKAVSIVWVFCNHCSLLLFFSLSFNDQERFMGFSSGLLEQLFANGLVAVDIFFFMTSFIVAYVYLQPKYLNKKYGLFQEAIIPLVKRAAKFLLVTLLATAYIFILLDIGNGPVFHFSAGHFEDLCLNTWWHVFFFGTNFVDTDKTCVAASWYVSADIQLYVFCMMYIYFYKRKRIVAYILLASSMVISVISTALIQHYKRHPPTMLLQGIDVPNWHSYFTDNHYPQDHFFPYGCGLALGTLLARRQKYRLSIWMKVIGWIVSLSMSFYVLFATLPWSSGLRFSHVESMIYIVLQKPLMSLSLTWLSFVCATGNAGRLNTFLSSNIFAMFGKLILLLFLTNLSTIAFLIGGIDSSINSKKLYVILFFVQALILSCFVSAVLYLIFELPLTELLNMITGRSKPNENHPREIGRDDSSKSTIPIHNSYSTETEDAT